MARGRPKLRAALAAIVAAAGAVVPVLALESSASASVAASTSTVPAIATRSDSFAGSCQFSGPITPDPPITVIPRAGSHFSYSGSGTCSGTLDGVTVTAAPQSLGFTNAATLFDTCEVGPDVGLDGEMTIGGGTDRAEFQITINLARLALTGPFQLTASGGGQATGTATFMPSSTAAGVQECAGSGISAATLAGSFKTTSALLGAPDPATRTSTTPTTAPPQSCLALRRLVLRFHAGRGQRITLAAVYMNGRRVGLERGRRLTSVTLTGLTPGLHRIKLLTRSNRGTVRAVIRRIRICASPRRA